jgi:hypothetical protein
MRRLLGKNGDEPNYHSKIDEVQQPLHVPGSPEEIGAMQERSQQRHPEMYFGWYGYAGIVETEGLPDDVGVEEPEHDVEDVVSNSLVLRMNVGVSVEQDEIGEDRCESGDGEPPIADVPFSPRQQSE